MTNANDNESGAPKSGKSAFPSLENSPLWHDDFLPPADQKKEETPPLIIIRESFPRIAEVIELLWGSREMDVYFNKLIVDERHDREGFPKEILQAFLKLSADHAKRFSFSNKEQVWSDDPYHKHAFKKP